MCSVALSLRRRSHAERQIRGNSLIAVHIALGGDKFFRIFVTVQMLFERAVVQSG